MKRRHEPVDETWLQCVAEDLRDIGCDEDFIACTLDELREGADVTIVLHENRTFGRKTETTDG